MENKNNINSKETLAQSSLIVLIEVETNNFLANKHFILAFKGEVNFRSSL